MADSISTRPRSDVAMAATHRETKLVWIALQKVGSAIAGTVLVALVLTLLLRG